MRTEEQIYAEFTMRDKQWPHCACGFDVQSHSEKGACPSLRGMFYRPVAPLTERQQELEWARGRRLAGTEETVARIAKGINQLYEGAITYGEFIMLVFALVPPPADNPAEDFFYAPLMHAALHAKLCERMQFAHDDLKMQEALKTFLDEEALPRIARP